MHSGSHHTIGAAALRSPTLVLVFEPDLWAGNINMIHLSCLSYAQLIMQIQSKAIDFILGPQYGQVRCC